MISYGSKTSLADHIGETLFESSVISYGSKTIFMRVITPTVFESS